RATAGRNASEGRGVGNCAAEASDRLRSFPRHHRQGRRTPGRLRAQSQPLHPRRAEEMNTVFADSFYYFALANPSDAAHSKALKYAKLPTCPKVTTDWVITELADGLSQVPNRPIFNLLLKGIRTSPTTIVPFEKSLMDRGLALHAARPDKDWSLTD